MTECCICVTVVARMKLFWLKQTLGKSGLPGKMGYRCQSLTVNGKHVFIIMFLSINLSIQTFRHN